MEIQENTINPTEIDKCSASYLLAIAIHSLFPKAELIRSQTDEIGFSYSCYFPFVFSQDFFSLIEERMRQLVKEKFPIVVKEMVFSCARQYFLDKRQHHLISQIRKEDGLIRFFEYENMILLCDGEIHESFADLSHVKLYDFHSSSDGACEILGLIANDKISLKQQLKSIKLGKRNSHLHIGEAHEMFSVLDQGIFWHAKGLQFKQKLLDLLIKEKKHLDFEWVETPSNIDFSENHKQLFLLQKSVPYRCFEYQRVRIEEAPIHPSKGLFTVKEYTKEISSIFCLKEEMQRECISSLHFIQKISTILDLYGEYVLLSPYKGNASIIKKALEAVGIEFKIRKTDAVQHPRVVLELKDSYGRNWNGPFVELIMISDEVSQIKVSIFPSLERIVGLMIEHRNLNQ